ncbi:MAG: Uma2 family endonuclease [Planctomycetes bacterium]|nr:Uma2 family endonuclease [Planctomycetota bacterium]
MKKAVMPAPEIHYPESDGKPMAETELHANILMGLLHALREHFRDEADVYISGNMFLYYEEGNVQAVCAPDVFLVRGVSKEIRRVYQTWKEGRGPDFVIELTSRSTKLEDLGSKKALYAELGVKEYFLFDPYQEYLRPPLRGYRLQGAEYVPAEPSSDGRLRSEVTGLELGVLDGWLRLYDPATGERLLTPEEEAAAHREEARARCAEAEARLRAEEERGREAEARLKAEQAVLKAEQARQAAVAESARLALELERLRVEMRRRPQ